MSARLVLLLPALSVCVLAGLPAARAEDAPQVDPEVTAAVGRIGIGPRAARGAGGCTAVLIAPDAVLTATHCVTDRRTGKAALPASVVFAPGAGPARTVSLYHGAGIGFPARAGPIAEDPGLDVAVVRLASPVEPSVARPLPLGTARPSGLLVLLGYPQDEAAGLATLADCELLMTDGPVLAIGCPAMTGYSGGPALQRGPDGWEIAAIMVARQDFDDLAVTLAVTPEPAILPSE